MQLANTVAIVTGAASGLGKATAIRFVSQGAKVAILDLQDGGEAVAAELGDAACAATAGATG